MGKSLRKTFAAEKLSNTVVRRIACVIVIQRKA